MMSDISESTHARAERPMRISAADSPAAGTGCWCDIESWACPGAEIVVVRVSGELDRVTQTTLGEALAEAFARAPGHLVVDLTGLGFCCVRGFALLAEAQDAATAGHVGFGVSGLTAHQDHVATMLWPHPGPTRYLSVATALTAIRGDHALAGCPGDRALVSPNGSGPCRARPRP